MWCDFNFSKVYMFFFYFMSRQKNIFIRLANEKKERKSVFTKIYYLNNSIQSINRLLILKK